MWVHTYIINETTIIITIFFINSRGILSVKEDQMYPQFGMTHFEQYIISVCDPVSRIWMFVH